MHDSTLMEAFRKKLLEVLEQKFQVPNEFSSHLMPILERLAHLRPDAKQWEETLRAISEAYHGSRSGEVEALDETRILIRQFVTELKKMDESLKVLSVYLERLRASLDRPSEPHLIH